MKRKWLLDESRTRGLESRLEAERSTATCPSARDDDQRFAVLVPSALRWPFEDQW